MAGPAGPSDSDDLRRVAIIGATGYTGAELVRLVLGHPHLALGALVGQSKAGMAVAEALPSLVGLVPDDATVDAYDADRVADSADLALCALPHGASAPIVDELRRRGLPVFDLSADFRLEDLAEHERRYGDHGAPARRGESVYGLPELHRDALRSADLVAVPGCFPTAAILGLAPLLDAGLVEPGGIVVDAKTGVSGAGRGVSPGTHFSETAEGVRPYKLAGAHRHTPEMVQELEGVAGTSVTLTFSPHLVPMIRGILATCYARPTGTPGDPAEIARAFYASSPAVSVLPDGAFPATQAVRGSNRALVSYAVDEAAGWIIAAVAIDNLVKGAAGQAIQCVNVRFGWPEDLGLAAPGTWP